MPYPPEEVDHPNIKTISQSPFSSLLRIPIFFDHIESHALIDTGAAGSFLSLYLFGTLPSSLTSLVSQYTPFSEGPRFKTISGEVLRATGLYNITFQLSNTDAFTHMFHVIDGLDEGCILGLDFLTCNKITVIPEKLIVTYFRNDTLRSVGPKTHGIYRLDLGMVDNSLSYIIDPCNRQRIRNLLISYDALFATSMTDMGNTSIVQHSIETVGPPISLPLRRTPEKLRQIVRDHVNEMLRSGIIHESSSPYAAPVVIVPKKSGEMRFCIDYRALNAKTIKDRYPLPRIDDTIDALGGAQLFSTLDLFSGYWQIEIAEKDRYKSAFVCEVGQFEFIRMPFGLTNAPATFQRLINRVLQPLLYTCVLVYLDDVIVFSKCIEDHCRDLETVFALLSSAGLRLKFQKCAFVKDEIDYLGHIVSKDGVRLNQSKINAVKDYPAPRNKKELSSFLGLASYYRKFIREFAEKAHHLTKLTKKNSSWIWSPEQEKSFDNLKNALVSEPILSYPDFSKPFIVYTDASGFGIGAVLAQPLRAESFNFDEPHHLEEDLVIAYSSKHLNEREARWSTTEKEAFAIVHAVTVFRIYLYGRRFMVITDHRPLEWLMSKSEPSGRLERSALKLQEYDIKIGYRAGKSNQNADCLSRTPTVTIACIIPKGTFLGVNSMENDFSSKSCNPRVETSNLDEQRTDLPYDQDSALVPEGHGTDIKETVLRYRVFVPEEHRKEILKLNHDHKLAGHLGIAKTLARIKRQYTWPNLREDVTTYVTNCLPCALRKPYGSFRAPLNPLPPVQFVWERIAMDIVGSINESTSGNKYILVLADYASRFVFTIPMEDQRAKTVAKHLVESILTKYGSPHTVLTDQGTNFLSHLLAELYKLFQVKHIKTTSYHPQTDGLVERFNRTLCDMLSCYVSNNPENWDNYLPFVTLAYNTAEQSTLKCSPFYLFFGRYPRTPLDEIDASIDFDDDTLDYHNKWIRALELAELKLARA